MIAEWERLTRHNTRAATVAFMALATIPAIVILATGAF